MTIVMNVILLCMDIIIQNLYINYINLYDIKNLIRSFVLQQDTACYE